MTKLPRWPALVHDLLAMMMRVTCSATLTHHLHSQVSDYLRS